MISFHLNCIAGFLGWNVSLELVENEAKCQMIFHSICFFLIRMSTKSSFPQQMNQNVGWTFTHYTFSFFRDFIITLISIADKDARDIFIDSGFFCAGVLERRSRFWLEELCQDSQRQQCLLEVSGARFKASSEWEIIKYCSFGLPRLSQLFGE